MKTSENLQARTAAGSISANANVSNASGETKKPDTQIVSAQGYHVNKIQAGITIAGTALLFGAITRFGFKAPWWAAIVATAAGAAAGFIIDGKIQSKLQG